MAVLKNKDGTELLIDCCCGCDQGIRFKIDECDYNYYCIMTYTSGNFFKEQGDSFWKVFCKKIRKICAIIRNKDYYYSDIDMTKDDFNEFKKYINDVGYSDCSDDDYQNDLEKVCNELYEQRELRIRLEDDRLEKEIEDAMHCNHVWKYLNEDETFATCSKCGVVRTTEDI